MKFPVPVSYKGSLITEYEISRPAAFVLADTKKAIDSTGNQFTGLKVFLSGIIKSVSVGEDVLSDAVTIRSIVGKMPLRTAEYVALKGVLLFAEDDGVEGYYPCPRCGKKILREKKTINGEDIDTRDFVSSMKVLYLESNSKVFSFSEPVKIINLATSEVIDEISAITMDMPTLDHTIAASDEYGRNDVVRLQFSQYAKAITHVNGIEVDSKWRAQWGVYLFEHITDMKKDLGQISDWILSSGIQSKVQRTCTECGKEWSSYVDVTNFFVSGLQ